MTRDYNEAMIRLLPQYSISFIKIARTTAETPEGKPEVISASRVRKLLAETGVTEEVLQLVPPCTAPVSEKRIWSAPMKLNQIFCGSPASLTEILDARSRRAGKQKILLNTPGARCLISFSLNIPGEIKCFPMAIRAFEKGFREIRAAVSGQDLLSFEESRENTRAGGLFPSGCRCPGNKEENGLHRRKPRTGTAL